MEYNTTHEQIIGGQRITTYISMTVTPVEEAPSPDANYVEALIEAAIYNHYPPIATPSEFKRVFAKALNFYPCIRLTKSEDTPANRAAYAVKRAIESICLDKCQPSKAEQGEKDLIARDSMIEVVINSHYPTINTPSDFKAIFDKAVELYPQVPAGGITFEKVEKLVEKVITLVRPDLCRQQEPKELISEVIAERWPAHMGLISTTNELKIAYRARAIYNEFAGSGRDKAVKAVEHAFKELVDKDGKELTGGLDK